MRIGQLSVAYNVDIRTLDYYTNLGILPCKTSPGKRSPREYTEESEKALKKILILRGAGFSIEEVKEALSNPSYFNNERLRAEW